MQEWRTVTGDIKPEALDMASSPSTVYERRNIKEETYQEENAMQGTTETKTRWTYEEREMTPAEYAAAQTMQQIMQAISDSEMNMTMAIVDTTGMLATENVDTPAEEPPTDTPAEEPEEEPPADTPAEEPEEEPPADTPAEEPTEEQTEGGTEDEQNV